MVCCQICGIELGSFQDYDKVQFHCWKYHPDIYESNDPIERREIILEGEGR